MMHENRGVRGAVQPGNILARNRISLTIDGEWTDRGLNPQGNLICAPMRYTEFTSKNGRGVVLRTPRWEDLDDFLELINSLVEEGADIIRNQKVTRDEEVEWLARYLTNVEKGRIIGMVAEVDGKAVGNSEVTKGSGSESHVGLLGISIARDYRNLGIGTKMVRLLMDESRKAGLKLLVLDVVDRNERARHVYKKAGFNTAGAIPNMSSTNDGYFGMIRMYAEL